jgi:hypothetical protein
VVEGSLAGQQFEGHHAQAPQVHRHVVVHALQDFGGYVVEGAAVGFAALVAECCPAEVAQFIHVLGRQRGTLESTTF